MNKKLIIITLSIPMIFIIYKYFGVFLSNQWLLLTARGYLIPFESSIYNFNPTIMNEGSGEWWIYGEDDNQYYYAGDGVYPYIMINKLDAIKCFGFNPIDFKTWCKKEHPKTGN